jgi:hypothetical protein
MICFDSSSSANVAQVLNNSNHETSTVCDYDHIIFRCQAKFMTFAKYQTKRDITTSLTRSSFLLISDTNLRRDTVSAVTFFIILFRKTFQKPIWSGLDLKLRKSSNTSLYKIQIYAREKFLIEKIMSLAFVDETSSMSQSCASSAHVRPSSHVFRKLTLNNLKHNSTAFEVHYYFSKKFRRGKIL